MAYLHNELSQELKKIILCCRIQWLVEFIYLELEACHLLIEIQVCFPSYYWHPKVLQLSFIEELPLIFVPRWSRPFAEARHQQLHCQKDSRWQKVFEASEKRLFQGVSSLDQRTPHQQVARLCLDLYQQLMYSV